jgi:hypothetical protein
LKRQEGIILGIFLGRVVPVVGDDLVHLVRMMMKNM